MAAADVTSKEKPTVDIATPYSELRDLKRIGVGSFSVVFKARHVGWGCDVAYKKFKIDFVDPDINAKEARYVSFLNLANVYVCLLDQQLFNQSGMSLNN